MFLYPPRMVASYRWVLDIDTPEGVEYAYVTYEPDILLWMCWRCHRERCAHVHEIQNYLATDE